MSGKVLEVSRNSEGITICFTGDRILDESVGATLWEAILREDQPKAVWFDLTDIQLVTSEVLAIFVELHKKGIKVVLLNLSDEVRSLLDFMRLDRVLEVVNGDA